MMDQMLQDHIIFLEEQIQTVSDLLTRSNLSVQQRKRFEAELRFVETALERERLALDAERSSR